MNLWNDLYPEARYAIITFLSIFTIDLVYDIIIKVKK